MITSTPARVLPPELIARLARFRLVARRRVNGRYAGAHASKRHGSSLDFADYREYARGDDPRRIDQSAYLRLGKLLVKLYEAEDEAAVRVVLDLSASMGFGQKTRVARELAATFTALAANGQDRVRVLVSTGATVDAGPWFKGPSALPAVEARLLAATAPEGAHSNEDAPGRSDLIAAIRRAHGEGPRGPVVLISDLMFDGWQDVVQALAAGRGDALCLQVLAREDVDPDVRGDLRLIDSETGAEVEVGIAEVALDGYARARDAWFAEVDALCGRYGISTARVTDDTPVEEVVLTTLRRLGVVGM